MNERAFLSQLESANTDELTQILRRPTAEEERVLEIYFGRERLQRLRGLALKAQQRATPQGNVVVLHGIMGGEMTVYPENQKEQYIWLSYPRLAIGAVGWLRMNPDLASQFNVQATGILKKWYSDMMLELSADRWNVRAFWFDWRLDLAQSAKALHEQINRWFGDSAPVNLVAHSMGGLVSRTYIANHGERWKKGGKLIMLGTPNHGSFAIPQVITGLLSTVRKLAIVDITHSRRQLCAILNTFPGSMQMLPSPLVMETMKPMYKEAQWPGWGVAQNVLDAGLASHKRLEKEVDDKRMAYIAGYNQVTQVDVKDWAKLESEAGYSQSLQGDGTVPHRLGFMDKDGKKLFPTYFVDCEHGGLPNHAAVIAGTKQLLVGDDCSLPKVVPAKRGRAELAVRAAAKAAQELAEEEELRELSRRVRGRTRAAGGVSEAPVAGDEIKASEILVRDFLVHADAAPTPSRQETKASPPFTPTEPGDKTRRPKPAPITIALVRGGIQDERLMRLDKRSAIAVGHYVGVNPQNAELKLDEAISAALPKTSSQTAPPRLLITDLCKRGVFAGELGQNFFLPDPREFSRMVVLAGMGHPGTFREAELGILARELAWTLGRSGRANLFTVLIGAGAGNLNTAAAVRAWLRGVRRALYDGIATAEPRLDRITFVEFSEDKFVLMHRELSVAVDEFAANPEEPLDIIYRGPDAGEIKAAEKKAEELACARGKARWKKSLASRGENDDAEPIRLTVRLRRDTFEFGALTAEASMPQRDTQIDPVLIEEVNNQLPGAENPAQQLDRGHLLGRLLLPRDLRDVISQESLPVVLTVDATTARIHWEMLSLEQAGTTVEFKPEAFLGSRAGLTRQLRTTFAQLPEPPLLAGRTLRVLVVADPAEDAPLPGAQEEGEAVAAIFEEFGRHGRPVEVLRLFGPGQATRVNVLDQLINHRFDILHYAGHCFFDPKDPPSSGWVFSNGHILRAYELSRVDRVPRFIFSNACESGITPDRAEKRSAEMAPSFAEAFFARGVANFVCTAWPVGDAAALAFARRVYRGALGLRGDTPLPELFHQAMAAGRREIGRSDLGLQTWGAYQHYGDPNFRFIPKGETAAAPARPPSAGGATRARRTRKARARARKRKKA